MLRLTFSLIAALSLAACGQDAPAPAARPAPPPLAPPPQPAAVASTPPPVQAVPAPAAAKPSDRLPLARVLTVARAQAAGEVIDVELDDDDDDGGGEVYEVTILTPEGRAIEVKIDARSGAVLEREED